MRLQDPHFLMSLFAPVLLAPALAAAEWHSGEEPVMGTSVSVELWHEDRDAGAAAVQAVMDEMHRINDLMSTWQEDTEMAQVNRDAAAGPVQVSPELFDLIERALGYSLVTKGAFDITYASVGFLYDYRERVRPDDAEREAALKSVDYRFVTLDRDAGTVRFAREGVRIDLGGIAKGYAVERGAALLRERGVGHAIVTAGGDSRIIGDRRGWPWTIGIRDPRGGREDVLALIPAADEAVSTSGDYERYFEADGVRYHHIINPRTGRSPSDVRSVTIIGPDATTTDALSTGVFVLGVSEGIELIDGLAGYETAIVDSEGRLHVSEGLSDLGPQG